MRANRRTRGAAVVEFALSFTVLWLTLSAIFEFGYSIWIYNSLVSRVSDGARFGSRIDFNSDDTEAFVSQIQNLVVYGNPEGTGATTVPNLTTAMVAVTWNSDASGIPNAVRVSINSYTANTVFKSFTFTNKPQVTTKYVGRYLS